MKTQTQLATERRNRQSARYQQMTSRELVVELQTVTDAMTSAGCPDSVGTQMREAAKLIRAAIAGRSAVVVAA